MSKIALVRTLSGFKPAFDSDIELSKKIKLNEVYVYDFKKPRNYKFHKKFFALINMVYQNQEQYTHIEHLRKDLIIESGNYDLRYDLLGVEIREAKSISFSSMDDIEFSELYDSVINVVIKYFHFDKDEILENIEQYY
jgi:hypothetical protein